MKKFLIVVLSVLMALCVTLTACTPTDGNKKPNDQKPPVTVDTDKTPSELDAYNVAYAFMKKHGELTSYETVTTGETVTSKIVTYTQKIDDKVIKHGDEYFKQVQSNSSLVKFKHQMFLKGDKVAYRNALEGDLHTASKADYKNTYGVLPDDVTLEGFVLNSDTVKFAESLENDNDVYKYRYEIDGEKGGAELKKQMKQYGGLNDYPVFSSVEIILCIKNDWTPVSVEVKSTYTINVAVLGTTDCTQNTTTVYSKVNGEVTVPDTENFNKAIGSEPSTVIIGGNEISPYIEIADDFANLDWKGGMNIGAELDIGLLNASGLFSGSILADIYVKYNEEAIENGTYLNAVNFRVDCDLHNIHPVIAMANMMGPMMGQALPEEISTLASLYSVSVYYIGDGYLYLTLHEGEEVEDDFDTIFTSTNRITAVSKISIVEKLLPMFGGTGTGSSLDADEFMDILEESITIIENESGKTFTLKDEYTALLAALYNKTVDGIIEAASQSAGDLAAFVGPILKGWFGADIKSVIANAIYVDGEISEINFDIRGITEMDKSSYGEKAEIKSLLKFTIRVKGSLEDQLQGDAAKLAQLLADAEIAAPVTEEIAWLEENMWLDNSYLSRLSKLNEKYEKLTDSQKALVKNVKKLGEGGLEAEFNRLKSVADSFLENFDADGNWALKLADGETEEQAWARVNAMYDDTEDDFGNVVKGINGNVCQIEYIGEQKIAEYLEARALFSASESEI